MEPILDASWTARRSPTPRGYDALRDDPVVGLPFYGSWPAGATSVPDNGWARGLNVRTTRRMAAGLGARTVRHNQEELMAAAWDQLGASARRPTSSTAAGSAPRSAAPGRRGSRGRGGDRVLAAPLLTFLQVGGEPARQMVAASPAPAATLDRVWLRRTPRARGASASSAYVRATRTGATVAQRAAPTAGRAPEGMKAVEIELTVGDPGMRS